VAGGAPPTPYARYKSQWIATREKGATVSAHAPVRPEWTCGGCGETWPCETRKEELQGEYANAPVSLALYLGSCLVTASGDLPTHRASHLHARFFSGLAPAAKRAGDRDRHGGARAT
jgi:hypothetical protein